MQLSHVDGRQRVSKRIHSTTSQKRGSSRVCHRIQNCWPCTAQASFNFAHCTLQPLCVIVTGLGSSAGPSKEGRKRGKSSQPIWLTGNESLSTTRQTLRELSQAKPEERKGRGLARVVAAAWGSATLGSSARSRRLECMSEWRRCRSHAAFLRTSMPIEAACSLTLTCKAS